MTSEIKISRRASAFWAAMMALLAVVCAATAVSHFHSKNVAAAETEAKLARAELKVIQERTARVDAELKARNAEIAARNAKDEELNLLREDADHGYMELDGQARVLVWNPGMAKITGYTAEEMIGKTLEGLMEPDRYEAHKHGYDAWIKDDGAKITFPLGECLMKHKKGHSVSVRVTARKIKRDRLYPGQEPFAFGLVDRSKNVLDAVESRQKTIESRLLEGSRAK